MSLHSRLDSHQICSGEFIVLVPFCKKTHQFSSPQGPAEESSTASLCSHDRSISSAANSAWLDMMSDLSHMSTISLDSAIPNKSSSSDKLSHEKEVLPCKTSEQTSTNTGKKRKVDGNHSLRDILSSDSKDVFDQQTSIEISRIVSSVNCLLDSNTGRCLLFERFGRKLDQHSCMCPSWLKKVLKCFSFLNILYAFFRAQCKYLTWTVIEEALKHPSNFGVDDVCISDVHNLSILCPKVISHMFK